MGGEHPCQGQLPVPKTGCRSHDPGAGGSTGDTGFRQPHQQDVPGGCSSPAVMGDASRDLLPHLLQRGWRTPNPAPLTPVQGCGKTSTLSSATSSCL